MKYLDPPGDLPDPGLGLTPAQLDSSLHGWFDLDQGSPAGVLACPDESLKAPRAEGGAAAVGAPSWAGHPRACIAAGTMNTLPTGRPADSNQKPGNA